MLKSFSAALLVGLCGSAALAGPLDRIGPHKEIYESYNDCFAATADGAINPAALSDRGWSAGKIEGGDGNGPTFFFREDRAPVLMLSQTDNSGICVVMAGFKNAKSLDTFLEAWGKGLRDFDDGQMSFYAEGQPIMFRTAGTQKKPRLNLVVGTTTENKE